jgi:serine/threonine-protein kinase
VTDADEILHRLNNVLAGHYDIERELGAGGMAHVFLANDVKHDRSVAVKVFRPELASSLGTERFLREIQIAAKLSHPHILPLYDSGEADGFLYYVMPLVEGESLGDRMEREGQLPYDDALQITRETADALNYAHARGLVHRDIKPDNIMLTGGHAVVMDFGIARAVSAAGGDKLTQTGMAVGTPLYMSPEQAAAVDEVDGRTDIYALGCVLYEMLTGTPPFTGPTPQAVMARHSMDHVPSPITLRDTIPAELEEILYCALAKSPADRFRTAADFAEALKVIHTRTGTLPRMSASTVRPSRITPTTPMPFAARSAVKRRKIAAASVAALVIAAGVYQFGIRAPRGGPGVTGSGPDLRSLAVMYFEDRSPEGELQYLADGLTEGLIRRLTRVGALDVVSRNGVAPYRGTGVAADSVARALQVGSVIRGSVEPTGSDLRVTVRLVDGASGVDVERAAFALSAADFLALSDSVVQQVAGLLRGWIGDEVRVRRQRFATTSNDAWALVQRGANARKDAEALVNAGEMAQAFDAFMLADSMLTLAEGADAEWVEPIVQRGNLAYRIARLSVGESDEVIRWSEAAMEHAARALAVEPGHAEALERRGTARYLLWNLRLVADADDAFRNAQADLEAAVAAEPTLASAHSTLSHLYGTTGDTESVVLAAREAYRHDAYLNLADAILRRLFWGYYDLGDPPRAREWCDEAQRRFPEDFKFVECHLWLMTMEGIDPDADRAWQLYDQMLSLTPESQREYYDHAGRMVVGGVIARAGFPDSARAVLLGARADRRVDPGLQLAFDEAFMRVLLGDQDEAIDLLKRHATANPDTYHGLEHEGQMHWWWRPLRDHPRVAELGSER